MRVSTRPTYTTGVRPRLCSPTCTPAQRRANQATTCAESRARSVESSAQGAKRFWGRGSTPIGSARRACRRAATRPWRRRSRSRVRPRRTSPAQAPAMAYSRLRGSRTGWAGVRPRAGMANRARQAGRSRLVEHRVEPQTSDGVRRPQRRASRNSSAEKPLSLTSTRSRPSSQWRAWRASCRPTSSSI